MTNDSDDEFTHLNSEMIQNASFIPFYKYKDGVNIIEYQFEREGLNPLTIFIGTILMAILVGIIGANQAPEFTTHFAENILEPIHETYLGLLTTMAVPMVFIYTIWAICKVFGIISFEGPGKKLTKSYIGITFLFLLCEVLYMGFVEEAIDPTSSDYLGIYNRMLTMIFPRNIIEPFQDGNIVQLAFLGILIAIVILKLGSESGRAKEAVGTANHIMNHAIEAVGKYENFFAFLLVIQVIWTGVAHLYADIWSSIAIYVIDSIISIIIAIFIISRWMKIPFLNLFKKIFPLFTLSLKKCHLHSILLPCEETLVSKLGVDRKLADFGINLGMLLCKLEIVAPLLIVSQYIRNQMGVSESISSVLIWILIVMLVSLATPSYIGGTIIGYTMFFHEMGYPHEALILAIMVDLFFNLYGIAIKMTVIPLFVLVHANKNQKIDRSILEKC